MTIQQAISMFIEQFTTFFETEKLVEEFEEILSLHHIKIEKNSELERLCLNITDIIEKHLKPQLRNPTEDIRPYFREFIGLQDLISKIIKAKEHPNFTSLIPHLKKLNTSNPLQNVQTSILNQDNNKILELLIATLCMNIGEGVVTVDDPDNSKGDNPDIIYSIRGKKWGFACKSVHSLNQQTIYENIKKAVSQIEESPTEIGIPIIGIKNIINHDDIWPLLNNIQNDDNKIFQSFLDIKEPLSILIKFVNNLTDNLLNNIGKEIFEDLFHNKKSLPLCLFYCATATSITHTGRILPTRLNTFQVVHLTQQLQYKTPKILEQLNHQLQLT